MVCACTPAAPFASVGGRAPVVGGNGGGLVGLIRTGGELFSNVTGTAETVSDFVGTAACQGLRNLGYDGQPIAQFWSSDIVQNIAYLSGFLPPPIMPWPQVATFAGDVLTSCKVSTAARRAMCRQRVLFQLLRAVMLNDFVKAVVEETAGDAAGSAVQAIGVLADAGEAMVAPVCTGEPPTPAEIVEFVTEFAFAVQAIEDAGGPSVFAALTPILEAAIGEDAVQAILDGQDPDTVVDIALADYEAEYGTPSYQMPVFESVPLATPSLIGNIYEPQPWVSRDPEPPLPPQTNSGGAGGALLLGALAALLS